MTIQVTGKHMETGEAFQSFVTDKIRNVLEKYIGPELSGHVRVEKEKVGYKTNCSIRLKTGLMLEAQGRGGDVYASADDALEHLEKRVRRYKRRLKDHHTKAAAERAAIGSFINEFTVRADDDAEPEADVSGDSPVIVAENPRTVHEWSVGEAVMQLDLTDEAVLIFRNAGTGGLNVVYRRKDGHIGWIDPASGTAG
ncbi:MAG: ribosome-associated translation inhibitor RaiA [Pseudomonadota bacterium]